MCAWPPLGRSEDMWIWDMLFGATGLCTESRDGDSEAGREADMITFIDARCSGRFQRRSCCEMKLTSMCSKVERVSRCLRVMEKHKRPCDCVAFQQKKRRLCSWRKDAALIRELWKGPLLRSEFSVLRILPIHGLHRIKNVSTEFVSRKIGIMLALKYIGWIL